MADNDKKYALLLETQQNNAQQIEAMARLLAQLTTAIGSNLQNKPTAEVLIDTLSRSITTFVPGPNITFGQWYDRHETIFTKDGAALSDEERARLLLRHLNQDAYSKFVSMILPQKPEEFNLLNLKTKLETIFGESKSTFQKRYDCLNVEKLSTEDFVTYGARVNRLCEEFLIATITPDEFKTLMFTIGLKSDTEADIRTRILSKLEDNNQNADLNIGKLVSEANRLENIKKDNTLIQENSQIHAVQKQFRSSGQGSQFQKQFKANHQNSQRTSSDKPKTPCWGCGEMHFYRYCMYHDKQCPDCHETGHKIGYCNAPRPKRRNYSSDNNSYTDRANTQFRSNHVVALTTSKTFRPIRKYVEVKINGKGVTLQLDNGSDFTIISENLFTVINPIKSRSATQQALDASSNSILFTREFEADITLGDQVQSGVIKVTKNKNLNVMGSDFMDKFGLFDRPINEVCLSVKFNFEQQLLAKYPELFSDTPGTVTKFQPKLILREEAKPIFRAKRPVPFAKVTAVEKELQRLTELNVITPVDFSEYAAPIVAVQKQSGAIRICGDYATGLNDQLQPCKYPLPTNDEMFAKLSGCKVFSKIDLSDAFLQIEIDPESRKLLTIHTHKGLFQFNRLAPGVKPAPGIFQQIMDTVTTGISGTIPLMDDILIGGQTTSKHNDSLHAVLHRLQELGFRVKLSKCEFNKNQIKFLGRIIDSNGTRPDPDKLSAIIDMQAPTNLSQLRSLLGAINYHSKYIKNLRKIRAPLDELTKQNTPWNWSSTCQKAFDEIKSILTSDLHLTHYDPSLPILVSADASNSGIGAYLAHVMPDGSERMVACSSHSLDDTQQRYSQIEKEGWAIISAVKKFHRYLFGRKFILKTDHKPLLYIYGSKKGIPVHVANRLQRWALILSAYDFDIQYVSTDNFGYVDVLSRLMQRFPKENNEKDYVIAKVEADVQAEVNSIVQKLPMTSKDVFKATQEDKTLQKLSQIIKSGWPENLKSLNDPVLEHFVPHKSNLYEVQGIIMMNDRVVIPKILQQKVIDKLHEAHPGIDRMKSFARSYVYWPNLDKDITNKVQQCSRCAHTAKMPVKTLLKSWPLATKVMERVHVDIAEPEKGDYYLVIVDARSKWPEVYRTSTITSRYVINQLKDFFSRYGKPELIVSDNGKQFVSDEFNQFCYEEGIEHLTTAYYQPQSNGEAERFIDTLKRHLARLAGSYQRQEALNRFLQYYRSSPNKVIDGKTPAELFLGRKIRVDLDLLRPKEKKSPTENTSQNHQFNTKHGAKERKFAVGDLVNARIYTGNKPRWIEAQVTKLLGDVLYEVTTCQRRPRTIRSHANQLRKRYYETVNHQSDDDLYQMLIDVGSEVSVLSQQPQSSSSITNQQQPQPPVTISQNIEVPQQQPSNINQPCTSQQNDQRRPPSTRLRRPPVWMRDYV